MPITKNDISRLYLKSNKSSHIKRFINMISIYDKFDKLYEYKITFEGLPKNDSKWTYLEGATIDSVNGMRKVGKRYFHNGLLSIGYHSDGNLMYKIGEKNFKPTFVMPINKIDQPVLFLKIIGFNLSFLLSPNSTNKVKENLSILTLENYSDKTQIACDVYFSKGNNNIGFIEKEEKVSLKIPVLNLFMMREKIFLCISIFTRHKNNTLW